MASADRKPPAPRLRLGIVLGSAEEDCTIIAGGRAAAVPYARPFPRPRTERVRPGHLVAVAAAGDGPGLVIWRWFDAVVVDQAGTAVTLWEPNHGSVVAQPRDPHRSYRPGSRAYASAGLPGADWWVAGAVVDRAEEAEVDLDEVRDFFSSNGLWESLS